MKTLRLLRHSLKDGANDSIGQKGAELARGEGIDARNERFTRFFHGPLVRTMQTAYHYSRGLGYQPAIVSLSLNMGDDALFKAMVNDDFKRVQKTKPNLAAIDEVHSTELVQKWQMAAAASVVDMLDQMNDGEHAVGFFHSPTIELAVRELVPAPFRLEGWDNLKEMDGVVLVENNGGLLLGVDKIVHANRG